MKNSFFICLLLCLLSHTVQSQEALKSAEEEYYDFLALQGYTKRPTLNYRTLSDSRWNIDETTEHPWQEQNLGVYKPFFGDSRMKAYGTELFMSVNTAAPYGQNDGVLWQGRGFNALLKGGVRLEGYGVELTLLPHFTFSQNADFDIMPSAYENKFGYIWGYSFNIGVDAPQRFGDKPFLDWDSGDSEIRYTWKTLTVGFGTQAIWLGPSQINSIIHSNNAPSYPKIDIGLRKQRVTLPWINWYIGEIEFRLWAGRLQESDYFDSYINDYNTNSFNLISGLSFAYAPSFLPGFCIYFNRIYTADWVPSSALTLLHLIIPNMIKEGGADIWDQHFSLGFDYFFPKVNFDLYAEIAYNDTPGISLEKLISNFSHTIAFTAGIKKGITISNIRNIHSEIIFECTYLEMSTFYSQFYWSNNFYMHHEIVQGYTNRGQWIGAGIGTGGNSQYLGYKVYYTKGFFNIFLYRFNNDNDFMIRETTPSQGYPYGKSGINVHNQKTTLTVGLESCYFLTKNLSLTGEIAFNEIFHNFYDDSNLHNFRLALNIKMYF
jgi:hypothetical protein